MFEGSPASEETSSGEERSSGSEGSVRPRRVSSAHTEASLPDWISFDGEQRLFRFSPETGAHVGKHVLRVRGRDASGKTETADFALHVSATNDAPEADVSIEGSLEEGRVVHLRVAGLSDEDGVPSSSRSHRYRWYESSEPEVQSSWSLISGAESASFRVGSGQAGKYLRGVFSYMDSGGTRERVFAQSEEVVRRKSLPSVVVPIFGGEKESSSSSVSVSEEGEALEMVSRSLSQAQERLSLMRNRRSSGSGVPSLPPPRFSLPPVLSEPRVQPPSSQGSGAQDSTEPTSARYDHTAEWWRIVSAFLATSGLAGGWGANSAEPASTRYERAAERRRIVAALLATSGLAGGWGASSAEPTSTRYERAAERWRIVATFLATSELAGEWGASSAEPASTRYERTAERRRTVAAFLATSNLAGKWDASSAEPTSARYERAAERWHTIAATSLATKFRRAHKRKVRARSRAMVHRRSLPRNLQPRREVGCKLRRAHKRKVRARSKATAHRLSSRCRRRPPRSLALPHSKISPSSKVPTRRPNPRKEPQSRSLQRMRQNRKSAKMHQSRKSWRGSRRMYRSRSSRRTRHPSSSTPVSRKTDPLSDTELQKDLGGSELPTSVRLSPHDIHTEITFISEDEVDVQLSLAEGAPMEISVRALAAQLTGDDAVRIEILDLPEGLRFDRETGMLEDTLGSGLSADGVAEVRVMLTDAQGRRMTVTLQVLSAEGLSQPEAATKLEGRTQTDDRTGSGGLGGGRRDVGGSSDGAGLSDEGEGSEDSDGVGDAALEELSGDKEARSSSGSAGALSSEGFFANFFGKGGLRLRSLSLSDFFLDLFRGFSSEKEIVLGRDISSGSADGDGEVSQTPSRSSLETQVAELGVHGRARSLVASLRDLGTA